MKRIYLLLALGLLAGCAGQPAVIPTQTSSPSPTSVPTAAAKSVFLDAYAWNDAYGDGYIARLPIRDLEDLPPESIVQRLLIHWLDHYTVDCSDPLFRLQGYSIDTFHLEKGYLGYEILAVIQYSILPAQPLTADYKGEVQPNGYTSLPGELAPDGTLNTSAHFGVFRDGDYFRLRILIGWGT